MSGMNPFQSCSLEFRKAKGKHTWLLFLTLLGINMAYLFLSMRQTDTKMLSSAWEQTLFSIPLINTLFLSVVMAVLSSGAYDIEHKGNTWNLLQTMQSRQSIFLGKTLYGLIWLILFGALQGISMIAVSKYLGFIGVLPISKIIIAVFSEIISGMVVYQIGCLLALLFPSQFAALSINLGGTLSGFFLMFVTDRPATPCGDTVSGAESLLAQYGKGMPESISIQKERFFCAALNIGESDMTLVYLTPQSSILSSVLKNCLIQLILFLVEIILILTIMIIFGYSILRSRDDRLKLLNYQINPHFLYNTLDMINWKAIDQGNQEIYRPIQELSRFYKITLNHGEDYIRIRDEVEQMRLYLDLQNMRFANSITYTIDSDSVPGFDDEFPKADADEFRKLATLKRDTLLAAIGENRIWEWQYVPMVLVTGRKAV